MITAVLTFLGGATFRMIWGEVSTWLNNKQSHTHELQRLELEARMAAEAHARQMESARLTAELGAQTIRLQGDADVLRGEVGAFEHAVEATGRSTGSRLADVWNGCIRPALATEAMVMWLGDACKWWTLGDNGWALVGAALGVYVADRTLFKRGK
jgi:hypothetical protein